MPETTYLEYKAEVFDATIESNIANEVGLRVFLNRAIRAVISDLDLRSTKKKSTLSPNLFDDIYDYSCPTDIKATGLIDVIPQVNRPSNFEIELTTQEEFDRRKTIDRMLVAFSDKDFVRKLRISVSIDDEELLLSELDSLTSGGGTWELFGDGTNLTQDQDNFVKGSGSINWDISSAGGTTAGIQNQSLDQVDLSDYLAQGSIFVWVYITSTTNLTNFILRIGSGTGAYYSKTITTVNEGTAFVNGWNLLRFDLQSLSTTGSPDITAVDYVAIYMTKDGAKVSETDYRFDWLVAKRGKIHELLYYSRYGWQTSGGTWIVDSTADTDVINADTDELQLFILKAKEMKHREIYKELDMAREYQTEYEKKKEEYKVKYPSEAKLLTTRYYNFPGRGSGAPESV